MAQIDLVDFHKILKERNSIKGKIKASYSVFTDGKDKYLQIDMYGGPERKRSKISQTLQFDRETAKRIIEILKEEFNL